MIRHNSNLATGLTLALCLLGLSHCIEPQDRKELSLDDIPARLTQSSCAFYETCFGDHWTEKLLGPFDSCEQRFRPVHQDSMAWHIAATEAGTLTVTTEQIHSCVEEYEANAAACSVGPNYACIDLFVGVVEKGQSCERSDECRPGNYCHIAADCSGICTAQLKEGMACEASDQCGDEATCTASKCLAHADQGEVCGGEARIRCKVGYDCNDDLVAGTAGTCEAIPALPPRTQALGETCGRDNHTFCKDKLRCVFDEPDNQDRGTCQEPAAPGGACGEAEPDMCVLGERCVEQRCEKLATLNSACESRSGCAPGLFCAGNDTCQLITQGRLGEACESRHECASSICTAGKCSHTRECQPTLRDKP